MENTQETKNPISKKDAVVLGTAVFIIIIASYLLFKTSNAPAKESADAPKQDQVETIASEEEKMPEIAAAPVEAKTFNVSGGNFSFSPSEIRVKKGDKVKIIFKNEEGFHDWVLDEFNAKTARLPSGGTETIEFTADKAGTFEYYCSVGSHRAMGMKGNLVVEE